MLPLSDLVRVDGKCFRILYPIPVIISAIISTIQTSFFLGIIITPKKTITKSPNTGPCLPMMIITAMPATTDMNSSMRKGFEPAGKSRKGPVNSRISKEPAGIGLNDNKKIDFWLIYSIVP